MRNNISILRIIKNRIGYKVPIIYLIFVLLSVLCVIFFRKLLFDTALLVVLLFYTTYLFILLIKETIKINYFFKYGIETVAYVYKSNYALSFHYYFLVEAYNKVISPWKTQEEKSGICYRYLIDGQAYESNSIFAETDDTISLKEGSKIIVLVNPKNKNEAIIKELFIKK